MYYIFISYIYWIFLEHLITNLFIILSCIFSHITSATVHGTFMQNSRFALGGLVHYRHYATCSYRLLSLLLQNNKFRWITALARCSREDPISLKAFITPYTLSRLRIRIYTKKENHSLSFLPLTALSLSLSCEL